MYIYIYTHTHTHTHTAGKISIEHITVFLSKYISKGAVDITFSWHLHKEKTKQISSEIQLCVMKWNDTGKGIEHAYWNVFNTSHKSIFW